MKLPVITISREYGSGGRAIGEKVAEALNIPFYDNDRIYEMAKESGAEEMVRKTERMKATGLSRLLQRITVFWRSLKQI